MGGREGEAERRRCCVGMKGDVLLVAYGRKVGGSARGGVRWKGLLFSIVYVRKVEPD